MDPDRLNPDLVYGFRPVMEAVTHHPEKILKIVVDRSKDNHPRFQPIFSLATRHRIKIQKEPAEALIRLSGGAQHQGVIAFLTPKKMVDLDSLVEELAGAAPPPILVVLDGVTDSGNLGAIIRSAECFGISGIVLPKDRSASVDSKTFKASAGAVEHVRICRVVNLANALGELKKKGYWVIGLDSSVEKSSVNLVLDRPTVLVLGGEEKGLRPIVRRECDEVLSIPMRGKINSLNVASAAAVVFYQAVHGVRRP